MNVGKLDRCLGFCPLVAYGDDDDDGGAESIKIREMLLKRRTAVDCFKLNRIITLVLGISLDVCISTKQINYIDNDCH